MKQSSKNKAGDSVPNRDTQLESSWAVVREVWAMLAKNPDVTVGEFVVNILGIVEMDFDKASMVGAMVDAAIIEHWEQEEATL